MWFNLAPRIFLIPATMILHIKFAQLFDYRDQIIQNCLNIYELILVLLHEYTVFYLI